MKSLILKIIQVRYVMAFVFITLSITAQSQYLTVEEVFEMVDNKPSEITSFLIDKGWEVTGANKEFSDDNSLVVNEHLSVTYTENNVDVSVIKYDKTMRLDVDNGYGQYVAILYVFTDKNIYIKLNELLVKSGHKVVQDGIVDGSVVISYFHDKYNMSLVTNPRGVDHPQNFVFVVKAKRPV